VTASRRIDVLLGFLTHSLAWIAFAPILWMILTSFKTEAEAFTTPPSLWFTPTLENWRLVLLASPFLNRLENTVVLTVISTTITLVLGIPAAYGLAFQATRRSSSLLLWMISTRMLPPVAVIVPLYVLFRDLNLLDSRIGLTLIFTSMNLPLVVWMMRSFFLDLPREVIEATRLEGATFLQEMRHVVLPMTLPGLAATALLCCIFAWNEFFFAFNLTVSDAAPLSVYIASFKTSEGLFWAKMSAAATAAVLPVVLAGWATQRTLVRGLTMGAIQ
jgi:sorbitol/mannitol transport system permease protein